MPIVVTPVRCAPSTSTVLVPTPTVAQIVRLERTRQDKLVKHHQMLAVRIFLVLQYHHFKKPTLNANLSLQYRGILQFALLDLL